MENQFKPSLLSRVLTDDFDIKYKSLTGGSINTIINNEHTNNIHDNINSNIGKRIFLNIFILFTSLFLSIIITNIESIQIAIFKDNPIDNTDTTFKTRYTQIFIITLIFIIFTILILILIYTLLYVLIGFYVSATIETDDLFYEINKLFKNIFWNFDNGNLKIYSNIIIFTLIVLFIIFFIYFAIIKDFFNNLWFPNYINNDNEEHNLTKKYLINYAFIIFNITLFLVSFYFIFAYLFPDINNLLKLSDISIRLIYYTFMISIFSIFSGIIFLSYLQKDFKNLIIYFILFFILSILSIFSISFITNV